LPDLFSLQLAEVAIPGPVTHLGGVQPCSCRRVVRKKKILN